MKKTHLLLPFMLLSLLAGCQQPQAEREMNLFIGTGGDNGQVSPGASVPFGMVYLCPDSDPANHAGYDFYVDKISGISVNRIDGVGCTGTGGNLNIRPALPTDELRLDKSTEQAVPGFYGATLSNGVKLQLTTTGNVAAEVYAYPKDMKPVMFIDFSTSFAYSVVPNPVEYEYTVTGERTIEGSVRGRNVGDDGWYKLYFHMDFSKPFTVAAQTKENATLEFEKTRKPIEVRIGISSLNTAEAKILVDNAASKTFKDIRTEAARLWDKQLSAITVKGGTADQRALFYTSLYRTCLTPHNVTSPSGEYLGTDGKTHKAEGFTYYSSWSTWDTFRTKFPLLTLLYPAQMRDFCESMLRLYHTGKHRGTTDYEATPSVRTEHMTTILLDAYRKGITNLSLAEFYDGIKKEAEDRITQLYSPDYILETAINLWSTAQIADIIGETDDAKRYAEQAQEIFSNTWKKEFKDITDQFLRVEDSGLYEGTRWQYRWAVPQYLPLMEEWHGQNRLLEELTYFFEHDLYNQGNEPDIHMPFLFNRLGKPERAQEMVRRLLTKDMTHRYGTHGEFPEPYFGKTFKNAPDGFIPEMDEDDGTMSGWYVFASMGIYPMIVGTEVYELTSPLFDEITIRLENGKTVNILTKRRKTPDDVIRRITWNGHPITDYQIRHSQLLEGGTLIFTY